MSCPIETSPAAGAPDHASSSGAGRSSRRWSRQVASDTVVFLDVLAILAGLVTTTWLHATTPLGPSGSLLALMEIGLAAAMLGSGLLRETGLYSTADMSRYFVRLFTRSANARTSARATGPEPTTARIRLSTRPD